MTIDTTVPSAPVTDGRPATDDPRALFASAVDIGGAVVGAVRPDQLDGPTPCPDLDVRALLGHLVEVLERVAALGRGEGFFAGRLPEAHVSDDAWPRAWSDAAHRVQAAWSDDETLTRLVRLPWAELTGAATLVTYMNEISVHTWDLAAATGRRPAWDERVLAAALDAMKVGLPAEGRVEIFAALRRAAPAPSWADPFADAVPVAPDAPLIDRLVAWNGRRP